MTPISGINPSDYRNWGFCNLMVNLGPLEALAPDDKMPHLEGKVRTNVIWW